jgi:hypothetical protein
MSATAGKEVRGVTRATRGAGTAATTLSGAIAGLLAYVLVKTGLEANAEQAVLVSGYITVILTGAAVWVSTTFAGKHTPSDPADKQVPVQMPVVPVPDDVVDSEQEAGEYVPEREPEEKSAPKHRAEVEVLD